MIFRAPELSLQDREVIGDIEGIRAAFKYQISTPMRWFGMLRRNAFALAIQGSNSIEGYNVTEDDAIAIIENEPPLDAENDTWMNVRGYRDAMTYVLQLSKDPRFTYNEGYIRSLHYMMLSHDLTKHPGNWRPGPVFVRDQTKRKTVYEGPDVEEVPELIDELINSLNHTEFPHTIVKAAMAHLNLVMIHPFSDGNGRMARCLQTLVMAKEGILEPTFCSIEEYLGRNTLEYYSVLEDVGQGSYRPENDATKWIRFNITAHYRQAATLVRRTQIMRRLWDELEHEISHYDLPDRTLSALAEAAIGHKIRNPIYRAQAEVSDNLAGRDLKALVDAGFLVAQGEKRGRAYIASERTKEIFKRVYEPPKNIDPYDKPPKGSLDLPFNP